MQNRAAREKLGLSADSKGAKKCSQQYHGTDGPPENCPSCQSLVTAQPVIAESYEPHLNMYIETRAIPRFDADHQLVGLIHVVRDITERKRMEALLESRKTFAENLVQNSAVAAFVLDPAHKVVLWNKACEELKGIAAPDMIGADNHWKPFYEEKRTTLADIVIDRTYDHLSSLRQIFALVPDIERRACRRVVFERQRKEPVHGLRRRPDLRQRGRVPGGNRNAPGHP